MGDKDWHDLADLLKVQTISTISDVRLFGNMVLIDARHEQFVSELNAKLATKASYALFALGWGLGLLGKLLKLPALGGDEK